MISLQWGGFRFGLIDKIRGVSLEKRIELDLGIYRNHWEKWCDNENDKLDYEVRYKMENKKFPYND